MTLAKDTQHINMLNMLRFFLDTARQAKEESCDKHTKLGAAVVDLNCLILVTASNTMPEGIEPTDERLERPLKYNYIEHAERNACFHAAKFGIKLDGTVMFMSDNPVPCTECARAIIQVGIKMIVGRNVKNVASSKWDESCNLALEMLKKAGVVVVYVADDLALEIVGNPEPTYAHFLQRIAEPLPSRPVPHKKSTSEHEPQ